MIDKKQALNDLFFKFAKRYNLPLADGLNRPEIALTFFRWLDICQQTEHLTVDADDLKHLAFAQWLPVLDRKVAWLDGSLASLNTLPAGDTPFVGAMRKLLISKAFKDIHPGQYITLNAARPGEIDEALLLDGLTVRQGWNEYGSSPVSTFRVGEVFYGCNSGKAWCVVENPHWSFYRNMLPAAYAVRQMVACFSDNWKTFAQFTKPGEYVFHGAQIIVVP